MHNKHWMHRDLHSLIHKVYKQRRGGAAGRRDQGGRRSVLTNHCHYCPTDPNPHSLQSHHHQSHYHTHTHTTSTPHPNPHYCCVCTSTSLPSHQEKKTSSKEETLPIEMEQQQQLRKQHHGQKQKHKRAHVRVAGGCHDDSNCDNKSSSCSNNNGRVVCPELAVGYMGTTVAARAGELASRQQEIDGRLRAVQHLLRVGQLSLVQLHAHEQVCSLNTMEEAGEESESEGGNGEGKEEEEKPKHNLQQSEKGTVGVADSHLAHSHNSHPHPHPHSPPRQQDTSSVSSPSPSSPPSLPSSPKSPVTRKRERKGGGKEEGGGEGGGGREEVDVVEAMAEGLDDHVEPLRIPESSHFPPSSSSSPPHPPSPPCPHGTIVTTISTPTPTTPTLTSTTSTTSGGRGRGRGRMVAAQLSQQLRGVASLVDDEQTDSSSDEEGEGEGREGGRREGGGGGGREQTRLSSRHQVLLRWEGSRVLLGTRCSWLRHRVSQLNREIGRLNLALQQRPPKENFTFASPPAPAPGGELHPPPPTHCLCSVHGSMGTSTGGGGGGGMVPVLQTGMGRVGVASPLVSNKPQENGSVTGNTTNAAGVMTTCSGSGNGTSLLNGFGGSCTCGHNNIPHLLLPKGILNSKLQVKDLLSASLARSFPIVLDHEGGYSSARTRPLERCVRRRVVGMPPMEGREGRGEEGRGERGRVGLQQNKTEHKQRNFSSDTCSHPRLSMAEDLPSRLFLDSTLKSILDGLPYSSLPAPSTNRRRKHLAAIGPSSSEPLNHRHHSNIHLLHNHSLPSSSSSSPFTPAFPLDADKATILRLTRKRCHTPQSDGLRESSPSASSPLPYYPSTPTLPPQHLMGSRKKRMLSTPSYDIDNIVIPYSMASSTRPEKLEYKEIITPGWRQVLGEEGEGEGEEEMGHHHQYQQQRNHKTRFSSSSSSASSSSLARTRRRTLSLETPASAQLSGNGEKRASLSGNGEKRASLSGGEKRASLSGNGEKRASLSGNGEKRTSLSGNGEKRASLSGNGEKRASLSGNGEKRASLSGGEKRPLLSGDGDKRASLSGGERSPVMVDIPVAGKVSERAGEKGECCSSYSASSAVVNCNSSAVENDLDTVSKVKAEAKAGEESGMEVMDAAAEGEVEEDASDEAFLSRHTACEMTEKKRFLNFISGNQKKCSRTQSMASTPDSLPPQALPSYSSSSEPHPLPLPATGLLLGAGAGTTGVIGKKVGVASSPTGSESDAVGAGAVSSGCTVLPWLPRHFPLSGEDLEALAHPSPPPLPPPPPPLLLHHHSHSHPHQYTPSHHTNNSISGSPSPVATRPATPSI